jgi:hypothetical protein
MCLPHVVKADFTVPFKESTINRLVDLYKRDIRARISWIPCIGWIKQAMSLGYITSLSLIDLISRQTPGRGLVSSHLAHDSEIRPRSRFEVKKRLGSERSAGILLQGKAHVAGHTRKCQICQWVTTLDTTSLGNPQLQTIHSGDILLHQWRFRAPLFTLSRSRLSELYVTENRSEHGLGYPLLRTTALYPPHPHSKYAPCCLNLSNTFYSHCSTRGLTVMLAFV